MMSVGTSIFGSKLSLITPIQLGFIEGGCHSYHEDLDDILHDTAKTGIVR